MKKNFKTAGMLAAALAMAAPTSNPKAAVTQQSKTINVSETKATPIVREKSGQGISVNDMGGLDFVHVGMLKENPIYFPKRHTIMTWNQQRQKAKKRRKAK